jgi:hypothetical protein
MKSQRITSPSDSAALQDETQPIPTPAPDSGAEPNLLREIYAELCKLRAMVGDMQNRIANAAPVQAARAISIDAAQALLGCGRSRIFELLRSGALRRAPKVGKVAMITLDSLEALQECFARESAPKRKRQLAQQSTGRAEKDAILKLIRQA